MDEYEVTTSNGETIVGPVTLDQVRRGLAAAKIPPTAQIRKRGEGTWHPVLASLAWETKPTAAPAVAAPGFPEVAPPSPAQDSRTANWMHLAAAAAEAGNREEAYSYYTKVLEFQPSNHEAWFGKALAAGWGSGLRGDRFGELVSGIERAISIAPNPLKAALSIRAAAEINQITTAYFNLSSNHAAEYISLDDTWEEHVARCIQILSSLAAANRLDPQNREVLTNAIDLTKSMIEGVEYEDDHEDANDTRYKHLPPSMDAKAKEVLADFVGKLQALDPSYKAPEIRKAGAFSTSGCIGCLVVLSLLGLGAFGILQRDTGGPSGSASPLMSSSAPIDPASVPPTVTRPWCAQLALRMEQRLRRETLAKYAGRRDDASVTEAVNQYVRNLTYNCIQAVGQPTGGEWACYWDAGLNSYKECENLRVPVPASAVAETKKANALPSEKVKEVPNCTFCSTQEDFDAAVNAGSKCCPVTACASDSHCFNGRVCCKIPGGQLCADPARCGANRVSDQ